MAQAGPAAFSTATRGRSYLHALFDAWEAVQVELRGRYSLSRLREIIEHAKTSSLLVNYAAVMFTPIPSLILLLAMDALPLNAPHLPYSQQTLSVTFRIFFTGWLPAFMISHQVHQSSPTLPFSTARHLSVATITGITCASVYVAIAIYVGFPVPFAVQTITGPWAVAMYTTLWFTWKDALKVDAAAREGLNRYFNVFWAQVAIITLYVTYNVAFTVTPREYQTYVSFCLPVMKLMFKNWASQGVFHMEDLAPSVIVFNVDAFHAMFVSTTMQQASSNATIGVIMVVDVVQSLIACYEVQSVVQRVNRHAARCQTFGNYSARTKTGLSKVLAVIQKAASTNRVASRVSSRIASILKLKLGVVDYALHIIDTCPRIRDHPQVVLSRHLRDRTDSQQLVKSGPVATQLEVVHEGIKIVPVASAPSAKRAPPEEEDTPTTDELTERERHQLACVTSVLKMLHMVEFYILIEFVEAVIAIIYTLYLLLVRYLPNHIYYVQLANHTDAEILKTVEHLAFYASLEVISFIALCVTLDCELQHLSTIQQLAFVLQKHWRTIQTALVMGVFLIVQLSFEHFGTDYTFKLEWLKKKPT